MTKQIQLTPVPEQVFEIGYPFVREANPDSDFRWKPGIRMEMIGSGEFHQEAMFADAIGQQTVTVVAVFKPGKFPPRVFFTRKWRDPSGKVFGKSTLQIASLTAFRGLVRGYRHEFELSRDAASDAMRGK